MTTTKNTWGQWPVHLPDGHRLFRGHFDRYAIADDSGRVPEDTDDGVLWLDRSRPLKIETNVFEAKEYMLIPLVDDAGTESTTITNAQTLLRLATLFNWQIVNETGARYRVVPVAST